MAKTVWVSRYGDHAVVTGERKGYILRKIPQGIEKIEIRTMQIGDLHG